jgi:hypothetical protein
MKVKNLSNYSTQSNPQCVPVSQTARQAKIRPIFKKVDMSRITNLYQYVWFFLQYLKELCMTD